MAKSSRSSSKKANNQRKAANIFGPTEIARAERLSAKLRELAKAPKPESSDVNMITNANEDDVEAKSAAEGADAVIELDSSTVKLSRPSVGRNRIEKRKARKSKVVFPKYSDRQTVKNKKKAAAK